MSKNISFTKDVEESRDELSTEDDNLSDRDTGSKDLYQALVMADMFEEGRINSGYLIEEGWDLRDLIHGLVVLARAYKSGHLRKSVKELEPAIIPPIESPVPDPHIVKDERNSVVKNTRQNLIRTIEMKLSDYDLQEVITNAEKTVTCQHLIRTIEMKLDDYNLQELIANVEKTGVPELSLNTLKRYSSMAELLKKATSKGLAEWAYLYARYIIKGRWEEAEPVIASDPYQAYWYAKRIIKGKFKEAEKTIATN
ncbi:MAG TPA: hypothetical protein VMW36_11590, partial [Patescibacteria group bacterium]|nr:hypothetical protein [Patescibacteria group bacterium]